MKVDTLKFEKKLSADAYGPTTTLQIAKALFYIKAAEAISELSKELLIAIRKKQ